MRLLILNCSSRKRGPAEPIPAIERYNGPLWQVLRAYLRERRLWGADLDVYGLSAEYGLFPTTRPIPHYERAMDSERAGELHDGVIASFGTLIAHDYDQLCPGVSTRYLRALDGWERLVSSTMAVTVTDGTAAIKLGQLRAWLHGEEWRGIARRPIHIAASVRPRGTARIAGVAVTMTRDEALTRARAALSDDGARAARGFRDWYVLVDGHPVGAKWLAGVLSQVPTTAFQAAQARQLLLALGIDVERAEA
jgi:hypothetical protein